MKAALLLVLVAVVAILVGAFAFRGDDLERAKKPDPAQEASRPGSKVGFDNLIKLLQGDLQKVNVGLNEPRQSPVNAFSIKERLRGALSQHEEYRTLSQACDLLIYADQEHSLRQQSGNSSQNAQAWDEYRAKTSAEVTRLLDSLKGKQL